MAKKNLSKERGKTRTLKRPCGANEPGQWVKPKRPLGDRARYCETCKQVRKDGPRHKFDNPSHKLRKLTPAERAEFPSPPQHGEYVFTFGKHKKKTLAWVKEHHPSYFPWLIREKVYHNRADLKEALLKAELFPASLLEEEDDDARDAQAKDIVDSWEQAADVPGESLVQRPAELVAEDAVVEADGPSPKTGKTLTAKAKAKKIAHLKYMPEHQREQGYKEKPARSALLSRTHSALELMRMPPVEFSQVMQAYGVFENLEGTACKSGDSCAFTGWKNNSQLGKLSASEAGKTVGSPLTTQTVYYRYGCFVFRYTALGFTLTQICTELGLSEPAVRKYMHRARWVMAYDALFRQGNITFGQASGDRTVDIEADETCFKSWRESFTDPNTAETKTKYYWYVWFGFKERGTVSKMWLKSMGVRCSHDAPTVPQLSREDYLACLNEAGFCETTRAVMMTDSAPTFVNTGHIGVVDAHQVNHSEHEFARSVEVLANVKTRETRPGMASTNMLDGEWKLMKKQLQDKLSAKSEEKQQELGIHIRAAQWRRLTVAEDPWTAWCAAAQKHRAKLEEEFGPEEKAISAGADVGADDGPACSSPVPIEESSAESELFLSPQRNRSILGDKEDGVPVELHEQMEALAHQSAIPITRLDQRVRNKRMGNTSYGVPKQLAEALRWPPHLLQRGLLGNLIARKLKIQWDVVTEFHGFVLPEVEIQRLQTASVWLDYFSIPQLVGSGPTPHLEENQLKYIEAIPSFVGRCDVFVALVPSGRHSDTGLHCNFSSWLQRGWCRTELWCHVLSARSKHPIVLVRSHDSAQYTAPLWHRYPVHLGDFTMTEDRARCCQVIQTALANHGSEGAVASAQWPAQLYLETAARASLQSHAPAMPEVLNNPGYTPLHLALWFKSHDLDMLETLLDLHADPNSSSISLLPPLGCCRSVGAVDLLVQRGAGVNFCGSSILKYLPIHMLAGFGAPCEVVARIIELQADVRGGRGGLASASPLHPLADAGDLWSTAGQLWLH
eukprot:Skav204478  [mRNA]  locus=scaffold5533:162641:166985:- [translate_table: standard]